MKRKNETRWLCENSRSLERYSGQWVVFNGDQGLVGSNSSLDRVLEKARREGTDRPFVFHVPERRELDTPLPTARKK